MKAIMPERRTSSQSPWESRVTWVDRLAKWIARVFQESQKNATVREESVRR